MEAKFIRCHYGQQNHVVVLYAGIDQTELERLIQGAFHMPSNSSVVALESLEHKTVVPISVVCQFPQNLNDERGYRVLCHESPHNSASENVLGITTFAEALETQGLLSPAERATLASKITNNPQDPDLVKAYSLFKETDDICEFTNALTAQVRPDGGELVSSIQDLRNAIIRMLYTLVTHEILMPNDYDALYQLVEAEDELILLTFEIISTIADAEALIRIFRAILEHYDATKSCRGAQIDLLLILHDLSVENEIPHDQILLLVELCIQGNEIAIAACEAYQADQDRDELLDTLHRIGEIGLMAKASTPPSSPSSLVTILDTWKNDGLITAAHFNCLKGLMDEQNEVVMGAYEAYEADDDQEELFDTLLRVAKFVNGPESFNSLVEGHFSADDQKRLTELYEESNRAVRVAWEIYQVDQDLDGFIDTLQRILRNRYLTNTTPSLNREKAALRSVISQMQLDGAIAEVDETYLMTLVSENNPIIIAAFEAYMVDQDIGDLVETLLFILHEKPPEAENAPVSSDSAADTLLDLVLSLEETGTLSAKETRQLETLIRMDDDRIMAAYSVYLSEFDADDLVDTIVRIARQAEVDATGGDDVGERKLQELVDTGKLSKEEIEILKRKIRAHDPKVLGAYDVLVDTDDLDDFLDTIQRIAKSHAKPVYIDDMESNKKLLHLIYEMKLSTRERAILRQAIARGDSIVKAALEVYRLEGDEDDLIDTLYRVARHAERSTNPAASACSSPSKGKLIELDLKRYRSQLLDKIIGEMKNAGGLSAEAATKLRSKFDQNDVTIMAAFDVFETDNDVRELVDTLRHCAV